MKNDAGEDESTKQEDHHPVYMGGVKKGVWKNIACEKLRRDERKNSMGGHQEGKGDCEYPLVGQKDSQPEWSGRFQVLKSEENVFPRKKKTFWEKERILEGTICLPVKRNNQDGESETFEIFRRTRKKGESTQLGDMEPFIICLMFTLTHQEGSFGRDVGGQCYGDWNG